jgi:hypothetical protein
VNVGVVVAPAPALEWKWIPAGMELSWFGDWKLQHQTRGLDEGLQSDWVDHPDTNNPVIVPIDPDQPAAWFRLAPGL